MLTYNIPCQSCRSRKRKCHHLDQEVLAEKVERGKAPIAGVEGEEQRRECPSDSSTRESSPRAGRAGVYNPECDLADLSSTASIANVQTQVQQRGWPQSRLGQNSDQQQDGDQFTRQETRHRILWLERNPQKSIAPNLSEPHRRYLEHEGAFLELPRTATDALLPIYISLFNDLIPVLDGDKVCRDYSNGQSSIYLVRAICLVTCKVKQAAPFLKLIDEGPILDPQEFAAEVLKGLDAAMKADLEPDRMIKIQILALMHLHNDGPDGAERSSNCLSQAISHAWAAYLHLTVSGIPEQEDRYFLWWSLRNFDRLNKPVMMSAPFMIDDADASTERTPIRNNSYRAQVMSASLALGDLLATATRLYKASYNIRVDDETHFPSLSELMNEINFDQFHSLHKAYLEIWYHTTAMISCRYSGPESFQYQRRLTSAYRTLDIVSEGHERIPPLPLVPYSMSLATTVIYRAFCDGKRNMETVYRDLRRCYTTLYALSQVWTSARGVTKLTRRLLRRLEKSDSTTPRPGTSDPHVGTRERTNLAHKAAAYEDSSTVTTRESNDTSVSVEMIALELGDSPLSFQTEQLLHDENSMPDANSVGQPYESWIGTSISYPQLDMAFSDLFGVGTSALFQGSGSVDFIHQQSNTEL